MVRMIAGRIGCRRIEQDRSEDVRISAVSRWPLHPRENNVGEFEGSASNKHADTSAPSAGRYCCKSRKSIRYPERPDCWHMYYGDVRVGTIARRVGNPFDTDPWEWTCGFYPGSHPRECTSDTSETFDQARSEFEAAWAVFLSKRADCAPQAILQCRLVTAPAVNPSPGTSPMHAFDIVGGRR
jgi:hypothetical protein